MKNNKFLILTIIFGLLTIVLASYIFYDKLSGDNSLEANNESNINEGNENNEKTNETCTFTKTHHIVDLLEDYMGEVPESTFILVDHFQDHYPEVLHIPNTMRGSLQVNKNYEFTYTISKNNTYQSENEILGDLVGDIINQNQNIQTNNNVSLVIKETNKLGLEQINEDICN